MKNRIIAVIMTVVLFLFSSLNAQSKPFWKKLNYAVGFSYGRCFPGKHLDKYRAAMDFSGLTYSQKLLEVSVQYPIYTNTLLEIGGGYASFPKFNNRNGLYLYLPDSDSVGYAYVTATDFTLSGGEVFIRWHAEPYLFFEASSYFCRAKTMEYFDPHTSSGYYPMVYSITAKRNCLGYTFGFGIQHPHFFNKHIRAYMKFRFGGAKEYSNDSIWDWDERLYIGLSGLYMGINFHFPGH